MKKNTKHELTSEAPQVIQQPLLLNSSMSEKDVHVWHISTDAMLPHRAQFLKLLTDKELARASRYRTEIEKHRFVADRGLLRMILSYYLGLPPVEVEIDEDEDCRASISSRHESDMCFSCAHTYHWMYYTLYAISRHLTVGVDIARVEHTEGISAYLSDAEKRQLAAASAHDRQRLQSQFWTRRRALARAKGQALAFGATAGGGSTEFIRETSVEGAWDADGWRVLDLDVWPGYTGAIAAKGNDWKAYHLRLPIPLEESV